jgi:hypothetical protein
MDSSPAVLQDRLAREFQKQEMVSQYVSRWYESLDWKNYININLMRVGPH